MFSTTSRAALAGLLVSLTFAAPAARAATFKVLYNFTGGTSDGGAPTSLVADANGNLYGRGSLSSNGNSNGMIFELKRGKTGGYSFKLLYNFAPCTLTSCPDGEGNDNGMGAVSGALPLVVDTAGNLYGVTGTSDIDGGKFFEFTRGGSYIVLYDFCSGADYANYQPGSSCKDGAAPSSGLTYDGAAQGLPYDGKSLLYGTTGMGGNTGNGTLYRVWPNGAFAGIHSFCETGWQDYVCEDGGPPAGPIAVSGSMIYGATPWGGTSFTGITNTVSGGGEIYSYDLAAGKFHLLHGFPSSSSPQKDGNDPQGVILGSLNVPGLILGVTGYGGTHGSGIIFGIDPSTHHETIYWDFCKKTNCTDGGTPAASIAQFGGDVVGVAQYGEYGTGVAYDIKAGGGEVTLHQFCQHDGGYCPKPPSDGFGSEAYGTQVSYGGSIFGVTYSGGSGAPNGGYGTVYEITP